MDDGIHLACGNSDRTRYDRTTVTWDQASARILELLNAGVYLSPAELNQAQDKAMGDAANALILTARDFSDEGRTQGYFPLTREIYDKLVGFPDCVSSMVEQA